MKEGGKEREEGPADGRTEAVYLTTLPRREAGGRADGRGARAERELGEG